MKAAYERKKNLDLTAECREAGRSAVSCSVEVGCRGLREHRPSGFLKVLESLVPSSGRPRKTWLKRQSRGAAAGGSRESLPLLHHPEMFQDVDGEKHK